MILVILESRDERGETLSSYGNSSTSRSARVCMLVVVVKEGGSRADEIGHFSHSFVQSSIVFATIASLQSFPLLVIVLSHFIVSPQLSLCTHYSVRKHFILYNWALFALYGIPNTRIPTILSLFERSDTQLVTHIVHMSHP